MMDYSTVSAHMRRYVDLDAAEWKRFTTLLEPGSFSKREFLVRQGQPCGHIYFVEDGILRAFHLSEAGKDSTLMFARRDWWITDMHCFLNRLPAMVNIQAVAPTDVF